MIFDATSATLTAPPSRSTERTPTTAAVAAVNVADDTCNERAVIDDVVAAVLAEFPDGGSVDSWLVAAEVLERRVRLGNKDACPTQTKDYVQYLFRESAAHVCRHADGHHYRVHPESSCSAECDSKYARAQAAPRRDVSECCFVELTTAGECSMCC